MKTLIRILIGLALTLAWTGGARAIPLSDLLAGSSITAGDKVFDQWRLIQEAYSNALPVNPGNIEVSALNDGGLDPGPGLRFDVLSGALTVTGGAVSASIDYRFGFRVTSLGQQIKDNSLYLTDGFIQGSGDNGFSILELVGTAPGLVEDPSLADLGSKLSELSWLDPSLGGQGLTSNLVSSASFPPQTQIFVSKNILVWATGAEQGTSLRGFEQRFSQVSVVPEIDAAAGTGALTLIGFVLALIGERRRKATA